MAANYEPNRYNTTPRKVFDKHVDRMELRRKRDKQDHRADMATVLLKIVELETLLTLHGIELEVLHQQLEEQREINARGWAYRHGREGL